MIPRAYVLTRLLASCVENKQRLNVVMSKPLCSLSPCTPRLPVTFLLSDIKGRRPLSLEARRGVVGKHRVGGWGILPETFCTVHNAHHAAVYECQKPPYLENGYN